MKRTYIIGDKTVSLDEFIKSLGISADQFARIYEGEKVPWEVVRWQHLGFYH